METLSPVISLLLALLIAMGGVSMPALSDSTNIALHNSASLDGNSATLDAEINRSDADDPYFSLLFAVDGDKAGISYKNGQLYITRDSDSCSLDEYYFLLQKGLETGMTSEQALEYVRLLIQIEPVLSYAADGSLQQDLALLLPWLASQQPALTQLLNITASDTEDGIFYSFTLHLRDLPAIALNLGLRALSSGESRHLINSLNLWQLIENAPETPAESLLHTLARTNTDADDLPALTLPITIWVDQDGKLREISAATTVYQNRYSLSLSLLYADGRFECNMYPFDDDGLPLGLMELSAALTGQGGQFDLNFLSDDDTVHAFGSFHLENGVITAADALVNSSVSYDNYTASLSYRPQQLNITCAEDGYSAVTAALKWQQSSGNSLHYLLDLTRSDYHSSLPAFAAISGDIAWDQAQSLNHAFTIHAEDVWDAFDASFTQQLLFSDSTLSHTLSGSYLVHALQEDGQIVPVSIINTITLN